ncbi:MAG: Uncharacterised protein [Flavobacteriaceae bacterium]|nr:MAG: Uncharacterised protein [Flavobacteriaceae bacterium]
MIQSMTGYGKHIIQLPTKKITVEIKSLNSKSLDLNTRVPSAYRQKELQIRKLLASGLTRGKIDLNLFVESTAGETATKINHKTLMQYMEQLSEVVAADQVELLKMAVKMPDALKTEREEIDEDEFSEILKAVSQALVEINTYRTDEGEVLKNDFLKRISNISKHLEEVLLIDSQRIESVKQRLRSALSDLKERVDENRFEQELIYYLEKYDITEEKVRLENHLSYFKEAINSKDSNGKKLGFITQEIGREINTIGSKSNFAPMQQLVVQMKDELEKIKEQALNVL